MENVSEKETKSVVKVDYSDSMPDIKRIDTLIQEKELYNFNLKFQRPVVWSQEDMSLLIESLITGKASVPAIEINLRNGEKRVIDGKNRLNAIFKYTNNKYKLSENLDDIILFNNKTGKDEIYRISGKYFIELDDAVQSHLLSRSIKFDVMYDASDEKENETMLRHNSGISVTGIMKSRMKNYKSEIQLWIEDIIKNNNFLKSKLNISKIKKERGNTISLLYNLLYIEAGIQENISITNENKKEYLGDIVCNSELVTKELLNDIENVLNFMYEVLPVKFKWMNQTNFIPMYMLFKKLYKERLHDSKDLKGNMKLSNMIDAYMKKNGNAYYKIKGNNKDSIISKGQILINLYLDRGNRKLA